MAKAKELTTLKFEGDRFADHSLDVAVLSELIAYKRLIVETAKEIWRKRNPDRQRLPRNFENSVAIKFYELEPGSTAVPLVREIPSLQPHLFSMFDTRDEIDEAVDVIECTINAADHGEQAPPTLPRSVIPFFRDLGESLRPNEYIVVGSKCSDKSARYGADTKKRILSWAGENYCDEIDLTGEVRATDLDNGSFSLRLSDGTKAVGRFSRTQEQDVLSAIMGHENRQLRVKGKGEFRHDDGELQKIIEVQECQIVDPDEKKVVSNSSEPIWKKIVAIGKAVPAETWDRVPSDLAENLRDYLYSEPKSNQ